MTSTGHPARFLPRDAGRPSLAALEKENQQVRVALRGRAIIAQAMDILMTRLDVEAEVAFFYLRRRSLHESRELVDVARDIVQVRQFTGLRKHRRER